MLALCQHNTLAYYALYFAGIINTGLNEGQGTCYLITKDIKQVELVLLELLKYVDTAAKRYNCNSPNPVIGSIGVYKSKCLSDSTLIISVLCKFYCAF